MDVIDNVTIDATWADVQRRVAGGDRRILVEGPIGSGRSILLERLHTGGAIVADPPPLGDPDAALHALLQLAAPLGPEARRVAEDGAQPLRKRARRVATELAASATLIAIRLPSSWRLRDPSDGSPTPDAETWRRAAADLIAGLLEEKKLRIVLLLVSRSDVDIDARQWTQLRLERGRIRREILDDVSSFGTYADAASFVASACSELPQLPSPLQFCSAVALRALGRFGTHDLDLLQPGPRLQVLETRLLRALATKPELAHAAYRAALARRAVPTAEAIQISQVPNKDQPLLTACLGYGSGKTLHMHERIRALVLRLDHERSLRHALRGDAPTTHYRYAQLHAKADGTPSVVDSPSAVDWLERVHHLAGSGERGEAEWASLSLNSRELYWARARALSFAGHYGASAEVYRQCLVRFGEGDAYAQHYLGFNLDRAGADPDEAVRALEKAVKLDVGNPWWNARLVTTLIDQAKFIAARREWLAALDRVDPTGEWAMRDSWLARHLHRWVVRAWLDAGQVEAAREAFDAIPLEIAESTAELRLLERRLVDAEEARDLGESVYPAAIAPSERWLRPRRLPDVNDEGSRMRAWYPGRVVSTDDDGVLIVFAVPDADPAQRRVKLRELTWSEWNESTSAVPEGFIEIGSYVDKSVVILPVDDPRPDWADETDIDHELRYVRGWAPAAD